MGIRRRPPVERRDPGSWVIRLEADEREVLATVIGQLDELIEHAQTGSESSVVNRLFPPAFTHHESEHEELDNEYQRLMREELITSRRTAITTVINTFESAEGSSVVMDQGGLTSFLQTLNALRVTLASALGVIDDDSAAVADEQSEASPEHHLYMWSGWMLEWIVNALAETLPTEGGTS
jgi:hypothetical protein